jgi:hypothetical protein
MITQLPLTFPIYIMTTANPIVPGITQFLARTADDRVIVSIFSTEAAAIDASTPEAAQPDPGSKWNVMPLTAEGARDFAAMAIEEHPAWLWSFDESGPHCNAYAWQDLQKIAAMTPVPTIISP